MTLDDLEKALWGIGATAVATLAALVRSGDVKRLDALEAKQIRMEAEATAGRDKIYTELHNLRSDMDRKHEQLVGLITERR